MQVTILGAGTAIPQDNHSPAGIYVKTAREHLLLDAGAGSLQRLQQAGLPWHQLDRIFLTHFHLDHCLDDVKLTKEVYEYGRQHHRLFATDRGGTDKLNIPVFWPDRKRDLNSITKTIIEACSKQLQVEIEYTSPQKEIGETAQSTRRVDIYYVKAAYFEGYCHLRKDIRQFKIERVVDIKPTWQRYSVPAGFVPTISG